MRKYIYNTLLILSGVVVFSSCNDFLDDMPDNRTEIDTPEKITKLLVSAYATNIPILVHEQMSDNVIDRGNAYTWSDLNCRDAYLFNENFAGTGDDSPHDLWGANYKAIASANMALEAIERMEAEDSSLDLSAQKGEALICRAYAHFTLCNTFCQPFKTATESASDLGIPYVTKVETTAINTYERGTVAQVYERIAADIAAGLPLIDDNLYTQPKYHFNRAAANAFAAEFYLYYGEYQKAIDYATVAIGDNPTAIMRDFSPYESLTGGMEFTNQWVDASVQANLFLHGVSSSAGRMIEYSRATHTFPLVSETYGSRGPTWNSGDLFFYKQLRLYSGSIPPYFFPKQVEYFVFTNEAEGIGFAYVMNVRYSVEKTLLNRAEAYAMLGNFDRAATDLSYFYVGNGAGAGDAQTISNFYQAEADALEREGGSSYVVKKMAPAFTVNDGMQKNLVYACLHARRILTVQEGTRLLDLKRYGIAYTHVHVNATDVHIAPYDDRLVLQIPAQVLSAGMERNPR